MSVLPRRFQRIKNVLNSRMGDLTVLIEGVNKPHNLSAILRSCDAVGILNAHIICGQNQTPTFNSTAQGSQKWVRLSEHKNIEYASKELKEKGFKLFGTCLDRNAKDYRECDFTGPSSFVLGSEKWGLSDCAKEHIDESIYIPMRGMVQSLNVSVATAILLLEAVRQRELAGLIPEEGEGLESSDYNNLLVEWAYPDVANWCKAEGRKYPSLNEKGEILEDLPRSLKIHC
mgnify:CR=1 FL=1